MSKKTRIAVVCSSNQNRSMEAHDILSKKGFDVRSYGTGSVVKLPGPGPDQPNVYDFGTTYQFMYEDLYRKDPHLYLLSPTHSSLAIAPANLFKAVALFNEDVLYYFSIWLIQKQFSPLMISGEGSRSLYSFYCVGCDIFKLNSQYSCSELEDSTAASIVYTQNGILHMLERNKRIKAMPERFQDTSEEFDVIFTVEERIYDAVLEDLEARGSNSYTQVQVINLDVKDNHEDATLGAFLILELCNMIKEADDIENEIEDIVQEFEIKNSRTLLHTVAFY